MTYPSEPHPDDGAPGGRAERPFPARRRTDGARAPVLPDCCNPSVAVRVLLILNSAALFLALEDAWNPEVDLLARLAETALLLEPAALCSLVLLCVVRRRLTASPRWLQWGVGVLGPAGATMLVGVMVAPITQPDLTGSAVWAWSFARGAMASAVALALIQFFGLRKRALSPSLAEARLQALQARIRPHFLFNSLNTVLGLMRVDPARAEVTLENLSELFRVFMKDTRDMVPIREEVTACQHYLDIEQLRLGERLHVRWAIDEMPGDALVPALFLQPLVENAVHHGIEPRSSPGEVAISIRQVGEKVRVEIVNPSSVIRSSVAGNQMGLSNVRERLALLYDREAVLRTDDDGSRFRLLLEFPCWKERRRRSAQEPLDPDR